MITTRAAVLNEIGGPLEQFEGILTGVPKFRGDAKPLL